MTSPRTEAMNRELKLEYLEHALTLPVSVNGKTVRFILDTGIGLTLITKSYCEEIRCEPRGQFTGKRMSGQDVTLPLSNLSTLALGPDVTFPGEQVGIIDTSSFPKEFGQIKGFLSLATLENTPFTIDYKAKKMVFEDVSSLEKRRTSGVRVPIVIDRQGPSVGIFMSLSLPRGATALVEVDTGSNSLILNSKYSEVLGIDLEHTDVKKRQGQDETENPYIRYYAKLLGSIHPIGADEFSQKNPEVMFQNIIYDGLVGDKFLRNFIVTYHLSNRELIFSR